MPARGQGQNRVADAERELPSPTVEVREESGKIIVSRAGLWLCRGRVRGERLSEHGVWSGGHMLVLDEFEGAEAGILKSDGHGALPALRLLLGAAATNPQRPWHVMRIDARRDQDAVVGAAWRFALEREIGCDVGWSEEERMSVFIYGHGFRSALARLARHASGLGTHVARLGRRAAEATALRRASHRGSGLLFALDLAPPIPSVDTREVVFRPVDLSLVSSRPLLYADSVQAAEVPLARGEQCFVGEVGGRVVFRMWVVAPEPGWLAGANAEWARKRSCYIHECYTNTQFRGRGIYPAALRWVAARLRDEGYEALWLHVMPDNTAGTRAVEKAGFRRVAAAVSGEVTTRVGAAKVGDPTGGLKLAGPGVLAVVRETIALAGTARVRAAGMSMWPTIGDGSLVTLAPLPSTLRPGQIVLVDWGGTPVLHRVVRVARDAVYTAGDACLQPDPPTELARVYALATSVSDQRGTITLTGSWNLGARSWLLYAAARARLGVARGWRRLKQRRQRRSGRETAR